jgi:hypothetical protein
MERWTKIKQVKKSSKKEAIPVFYKDYINYMEVAAILVDKMNKMCIESKELAHSITQEGFNLEGLAQELFDLFPEDMVIELMNSEFGQGILVGIYMANVYKEPEESE